MSFCLSKGDLGLRSRRAKKFDNDDLPEVRLLTPLDGNANCGSPADKPTSTIIRIVFASSA